MARPSKITPEQIRTILQLHKDGNSLRQILKLTKDYSLGTLSKIISTHSLTPDQFHAKKQRAIDEAQHLKENDQAEYLPNQIQPYLKANGNNSPSNWKRHMLDSLTTMKRESMYAMASILGLYLRVDVMSKVFNTLSFNIRNKLIQLLMRLRSFYSSTNFAIL